MIVASDGHANVRRAFDASGLDKNMPFIADFVMKEIKALGEEHVFSFTMDGVSPGILHFHVRTTPQLHLFFPFVIDIHLSDSVFPCQFCLSWTLLQEAYPLKHLTQVTVQSDQSSPVEHSVSTFFRSVI